MIVRWFQLLRGLLIPKRITALDILEAPLPVPPINAQCRALLKLDGICIPVWAIRQLGLPSSIYESKKLKNIELIHAALQKAFTLTREDLEAYLVRRGIEPVSHWVYTQPSARDGSYLVKTDRGWLHYYQERECRSEEWEFTTLADARCFLINGRISPWLERLRRPPPDEANT